MEDDVPPARRQYEIGQDISSISVDELTWTIRLLREEISRLEQELQSRDSTKAAAEALFRRG
ncbi:DUF1192 domain-containing protein [Chelativorans sp. Marseille-P2723]|uniref:DUF1192 domain-containing protein n=1 Tax=Chelativorans sp. Marseille-P2723 TaxID=2709133 RepID=UPI00156FC36B|nr:DUF1192 domain-containing protein [Chelativorans sp. Marseille-P2723]